jgi:hypothetical protein
MQYSGQDPQTLLGKHKKDIEKKIQSLQGEKKRYLNLKNDNPSTNYDKHINTIEDELFTHETDLIFIQKNKNAIIAENGINQPILFGINATKKKLGYVRPTNEKAEKRDRAILINELTELYITIKPICRPFFRDDTTNTNIRNSIFTFVHTYLDKAKSRREKGHFEHFGGEENDPDPVNEAIARYKISMVTKPMLTKVEKQVHYLFAEVVATKTYEKIASHLHSYYNDYFDKVINDETDEIAELKEYIDKFIRGLTKEPPASRYVEEFGGGALKKPKKKAARGKVHIGPRGGKYVVQKGRKVYV